MCKHVLNAQVSMRAPCCKKWYDCLECHNENENHPLKQQYEIVFACKKCKKCFRKDSRDFDESDEFCPYCDNHFVIDAITPESHLTVELPDARKDSRAIIDRRAPKTTTERTENSSVVNMQNGSQNLR